MKMTKLLLLGLASVMMTSVSWANGELPSKIKEQLSAEQIEQLENAESRSEKMELLKSFGIKMPTRRSDRQPKRGLPPEITEQLTAEQVAELESTDGPREKRALLESWGITLPERPERGSRRWKAGEGITGHRAPGGNFRRNRSGGGVIQ